MGVTGCDREGQSHLVGGRCGHSAATQLAALISSYPWLSVLLSNVCAPPILIYCEHYARIPKNEEFAISNFGLSKKSDDSVWRMTEKVRTKILGEEGSAMSIHLNSRPEEEKTC